MKKILFAAIIFAILILSGCGTEPTVTGGVIADNIAARPHKEPGVVYELTETDIHYYADLVAEDISILGVKLGDSYDDVILKLSVPDIEKSYNDGEIKNLEYETSIGTDGVGLLLHFEEDMLTRMSAFKPFNKYLIGKTVIDHDKRGVYDLFGMPERFRDEEFFRIFAYDSKGIDAFVRRGQMVGFSFHLPQSKF